MSKPWQNEKRLRKLYHGEGLSQTEVADRLGCSRETVVSWMKQLGVETRSPNETRYYDKREGLLSSLDDIIERYMSGDPLYVIAEDYGVQDNTLKRLLDDVGVSTRDISEQLKKSFSTNRISELDVNTPPELRDKEVLEGMYVDDGMSIRQIAQGLDCGYNTVRRWLKKHDIELRERPEAIELSKTNTPNVRTGRDGYEYIQHSNHTIRHHRLLATLLVEDISELKGKHIHHTTAIEWDNRPSKLDVLGFKKHMERHRGGGYE